MFSEEGHRLRLIVTPCLQLTRCFRGGYIGDTTVEWLLKLCSENGSTNIEVLKVARARPWDSLNSEHVQKLGLFA